MRRPEKKGLSSGRSHSVLVGPQQQRPPRKNRLCADAAEKRHAMYQIASLTGLRLTLRKEETSVPRLPGQSAAHFNGLPSACAGPSCPL